MSTIKYAIFGINVTNLIDLKSHSIKFGRKRKRFGFKK